MYRKLSVDLFSSYIECIDRLIFGKIEVFTIRNKDSFGDSLSFLRTTKIKS